MCEGSSDEFEGIIADLPGLPSADFKSESSDEEVGNTSDDPMDVFCRSNHMKSLGLFAEGTESLDSGSNSLADSHEPEDLDLEPGTDHQVSESDLVQVGNDDARPPDESSTSKKQWDTFEMEFANALEISEEKIMSGQFQNQFDSSSLKQDLLIEMITALHDSKNHLSSTDEANESENISPFQSDSESKLQNPRLNTSCQTRPRRQLLSLSTLETIHESEIDRALEIVENAPDSIQSQVKMNPNSSEEETVSPSSSRDPRLVWGIKQKSGDTCNVGEELMEQLRQLSMSQAGGHEGLGEAVVNLSSNDNIHSVQERGKRETERPTVFLDLRQKNTIDTHEERSDSDSDDDSEAWEEQRRKIKGDFRTSVTPSLADHITSSSSASLSASLALSPSTLPPPHLLPPSPPSHPSHNLHRVHRSGDHKVKSKDTTTNNTAQNESATKNGSTPHSIESGDYKVKVKDIMTITNTAQNESATKNRSTPHSVKSGDYKIKDITTITNTAHNESATKREAKSTAAHKSKIKARPEKLKCVIPVEMVDSPTFKSSSISEDADAPSSEGGSSGGDQKGPIGSPTASTPNSPKGKRSKKQAKKSKKSHKKEQSKAKQNTERSSSSQRRRAHILQRIRSDSFNTSSDEEHSLTSSTASVGSDSSITALESSGTLSDARGSTAVIDPEVVKSTVQRRILSKKPPSHFETPATDPVYHEDVSFSNKLLDSSNTSSSQAAILVLPVMHNGVCSLPSSWSELDVETRVLLHCLLLTWLTFQITSDCNRLQDSKNEKWGRVESSPHFNLPFQITGLQQTVLDGEPSILIVVQDCNSDPEDGFHSTSVTGIDNKEISQIEKFLSSTSLGDILQPLIENEAIHKLISSSQTSVLALRPLLSEALSLVFTYQGDASLLSAPVSFYWHSSYHPSCLPSSESLKSQHQPTTTVCTLNHASLCNPLLVFSVFQRIFSNGLDIAGMRTLRERYDPIAHVESQESCTTDSNSTPNPSMCLALALRGPDAIYHWIDIVGPDDSSLAKITDPLSITAQFGSKLVSTMKSPYRSAAALAKWFGGRACMKTGTVFGMSDPHTKLERRKRQRVRFSESESEDSISSPLPDIIFPPLIFNRPRLIVQAYTKCLLVISPNVPPSCYSAVLTSCNKLGFDIFGAKRIRLNSKRAHSLDISGEFMSYFTPSSAPPSPSLPDFSSHPLAPGNLSMHPPPPSVILIIGRENSAVHCSALKCEIVTYLKLLIETNHHIQLKSGLECPSGLIHLAPYTEEKLKILGNLSPPVSNSNPPMAVSESSSEDKQEELCFIAVPGISSLPVSIDLLEKIFNVTQATSSAIDHKESDGDRVQSRSDGDRSIYGGFELIGMKIVPQLSRFHAKKLCPLPTSDSFHSEAVQTLTGRPATLLVFRGICCNKRIQELVKLAKGSASLVGLEKKLQFIISCNLTEGVRLCSIFFCGKDLFSDTSSWKLAPYLPIAWIHDSDILQSFLRPRENLFSVLQLPLTQMKLVIKLLDRISRSGFHFAGISTMELGVESQDILEDLEVECNSVSSGEPVLVVCVERENSVWHLEHLIQPFMKDNKNRILKYSRSFNQAILDMKLLFPHGVHTQEDNTIIKSYNIKILSEDNFDGLLLPTECCKKLKSRSSLSYVSPLLERTVILLPSFLLTHQSDKSSMVGFIPVLEFLCQSKFEICGMKLTLLSESKGRELITMLSLDAKLEDICHCPYLILVLERDNAASCFQVIMKSSLQLLYGRTEEMKKFLAEIIAPNNLKQANQLLSFFHINDNLHEH